MQTGRVLIEGIISTGMMTLFVNVMAGLYKEPIQVIRVLGTMLTGETGADQELSDSTRSMLVGKVVHYAIGILFAFGFEVLWGNDFGRPDVYYGLLFGTVAGIVGISVWSIYLNIHRNPPLIPRRLFLLVILGGHVLFGLTVIFIHRVHFF